MHKALLPSSIAQPKKKHRKRQIEIDKTPELCNVFVSLPNNALQGKMEREPIASHSVKCRKHGLFEKRRKKIRDE
jgi:hypothetical protein